MSNQRIFTIVAGLIVLSGFLASEAGPARSLSKCKNKSEIENEARRRGIVLILGKKTDMLMYVGDPLIPLISKVPVIEWYFNTDGSIQKKEEYSVQHGR